MHRMNESKNGLELAPDARWKIWFQDNFDLECPRQVELVGHGLVKGLMELWVRHLFESVQPDRVWGFSHFNLWWDQEARSLEIVGEEVGQVRLRKWIFGDKQFSSKNLLQTADKNLLGAVARAHYELVIANQTSEAILAVAKTANSRKDFEEKMLRLVEGI